MTRPSSLFPEMGQWTASSFSCRSNGPYEQEYAGEDVGEHYSKFLLLSRVGGRDFFGQQTRNCLQEDNSNNVISGWKWSGRQEKILIPES